MIRRILLIEAAQRASKPPTTKTKQQQQQHTTTRPSQGITSTPPVNKAKLQHEQDGRPNKETPDRCFGAKPSSSSSPQPTRITFLFLRPPRAEVLRSVILNVVVESLLCIPLRSARHNRGLLNRLRLRGAGRRRLGRSCRRCRSRACGCIVRFLWAFGGLLLRGSHDEGEAINTTCERVCSGYPDLRVCKIRAFGQIRILNPIYLQLYRSNDIS